MLLSVLLGSDPPKLPTQLLVRTTELFGIAEGTTRTALSRMAAAKEVTAHGASYELTGPALLRRQARQSSSRAGQTDRWDGTWSQAVIGADGPRSAPDRAALRQSLLAARHAELREGVWLRPANLGPHPDTGDVRWFVATPTDDAVELAGRLWDLDDWASSAGVLRGRMRDLVGALEAGDRSALADGFVLSAAVLRQFQSDPLLPDPLLPGDWPGATLRAEYDRYDRAYRAVLQDWFRQQA